MSLQEQEQTKSLSYFRQLADLLRAQGVPEVEIIRAISSEMSDGMGYIQDSFPVTGIDLAGNQPKYLVPDTGSPPTFTPNPEQTDWIPSVGFETRPSPDPLGHVKTNNPTYDMQGSNINHTYQIEPYYTASTENWVGTASDVNSEPPMGSSAGYNTQLAIQPWRYDVEQSQSAPFSIDTTAILPSGVRETTFEFNETIEEQREKDFHATSSFVGRVNYTPELQTMEITLNGKRYDFCNIPERIFDSFKGAGSKGAFFNREIKTQYDCGFGETTRKSMREAIANIRHEFGWLEDDYLLNAKALAQKHGAQVYLIRAAEETITDHRGEGEPYRRLLAGDELALMSRTAVNKAMDINHYGTEFQTDALIVDSEYVPSLKQLQFLVIEADPEINAAISRGDVDAVSINGGAPRNETVEPCNHGCNDGSCELCLVPRGVILGELDDIGLTWVVTRPFVWRNKTIPAATAGVKTTMIEAI